MLLERRPDLPHFDLTRSDVAEMSEEELVWWQRRLVEMRDRYRPAAAHAVFLANKPK